MFFSKKYRIIIPEPCHEDWSKMTPSQQGRFCDSCAKNVTDFTNLDEKQINDMIRNGSGNMCGRFRQDQLKKIYTLKPQIQLSAQRRFFQYILSVFLGLFGLQKSFSQDTLKTERTGSVPALSGVDSTLADTVALAQSDTQTICKTLIAGGIGIQYVWPESGIPEITVTLPDSFIVETAVYGGFGIVPATDDFPQIPAAFDSIKKADSITSVEPTKETVVAPPQDTPKPLPPAKPLTISEAILPEVCKRRKED